MNRFPVSGPLEILVIEDNSGDFYLLKESILLSSYRNSEIHLAETFTTALDYLKMNKPHIIFLDLFLADSQGLQSFDRLKEFTGSAAVIILSGLTDMKIVLEAINRGAEDYLTKGEFDERLLEKTIAYAIERRRNMEKLRQANERYSLVTKATHDLIWDWDLVTGEIYRDEQAVKTVYGVESYSIQKIDDWNKRIHPDDAEQLSSTIEEIKKSTERDFFQMEYRFRSETGNYKIIYDRVYVVRNSQSIPVRLIGAAQDITGKRKLEEALRESRLMQQKIITSATIKGQEKEREQLGLELHDNINQILATSVLYLDCTLSSPLAKSDMVSKSKDLIVKATEEIRKLSHALLPPPLEEFGLLKTLDELMRPIVIASKLKVNKQWHSFPEYALSKDQQLTIYRIVQEQMNNILKHAHAKTINVSLSLLKDQNFAELLIEDDGRGFDTTQKKDGVGLRNIRSRAELFDGNVTVFSRPGHGCRFSVVFPIAEKSESKVA